MTKSLFFFAASIIVSFSASAQTIKTDVVVIGSTAEGISASIQSARSGVKTILITESNILNPVLAPADIKILEKIQNHFTFKYKTKTALKDSLLSPEINLIQSSKLLKSITDTVKNLTVMMGTKISLIDKNRKGWELKTDNNKEIKTQMLIDATQNLDIAKKLNIDVSKTWINLKPETVLQPNSNKLYRTGVGVGLYKPGGQATVYTIPLGVFVPEKSEYFLIIPRNSQNGFWPVAMSAGQAAGATAAYCAYFNTTADKLDARLIQGELLSFEATLFSFTDINNNDPNILAIQNIGLTGLLQFNMDTKNDINQLVFNPDGTISAEELRLVMKEYYNRSQIWFADNKADKLTIEQVIKLIMYSATRGKELKGEIEKAWTGTFKLPNAFDVKRPVTRREFAVLANTYLQPFARKVDIQGTLMK